ncbi:MAG: NAD(P)H-dependent oxidoreductase [Aeromicrobium sp.]|nr:NAD(P)H-dependent oxidoreductase [Aeromicrobium sp.]
MPHVQLIVGSTREDRFADHVMAWLSDRLRVRDDLTYEIVDLRDHPLPFFDQAPPAYTKRDYPNEAIAELGQLLDRADGYVFLTPEYNHGYSAVLKNAIDHTFVEWNRKPAAFVGWGNVGGARAIEQLRLVTVELEMAPLRHAVHVLGSYILAMREDGADPLQVLAPLDPRLELLVTDLLWWADALSTARASLPG